MTRVAIGAIMKQEAPYILEWVSYHRALGFELIIADNGGQDDTSRLLTALHKAEIITRIDFRFKKISPQIPAYRAILRLAKQRKIDIIGFLDCDEFFTRDIPIRSLTPEAGSEYITSEFFRLNATQIGFYWMSYGSKTDALDLASPVLERFSFHAKVYSQPIYKFEKSFIKVKEVFKLSNIIFLGPKIYNVHRFQGATKKWFLDGKSVKLTDYQNQSISYDTGAILHFRIKTWIEFQDKKNVDALIFDHLYTVTDYSRHLT